MAHRTLDDLEREAAEACTQNGHLMIWKKTRHAELRHSRYAQCDCITAWVQVTVTMQPDGIHIVGPALVNICQKKG